MTLAVIWGSTLYSLCGLIQVTVYYLPIGGLGISFTHRWNFLSKLREERCVPWAWGRLCVRVGTHEVSTPFLYSHFFYWRRSEEAETPLNIRTTKSLDSVPMFLTRKLVLFYEGWVSLASGFQNRKPKSGENSAIANMARVSAEGYKAWGTSPL